MMNILRSIAGTTALTLVLACGNAQANVIAPFKTVFDTDWLATGVSGLRGQGTGSIAVSGVTGSVTGAYLYWHGPTNSTASSANADVLFDGNDVTGTNIGFSQDNLWGFLNSQAYRADVTAFVPGDGVYDLANFIKAGVEVNGASLLVFFDDGDATNNRDVVMFDGNDSNQASSFDPEGWQATLNGINYSGGTASLVLGVSDGQNFDADDDPAVSINGTTVIAIGDDPFEGTSLPDAGGGVGNGKLWDITTHDITSLLSLGVNNLSLITSAAPSAFDALSLIHLAFDLPAGAAPDETVSEPAAWGMALVGVLALVTGHRRRRQVRRSTTRGCTPPR